MVAIPTLDGLILQLLVKKPTTIPESKVLHINKLTRNVNEGHLKEIFSNFGDVVNVELAMDRVVNLPKGYAYVEFKTRADAEKAQLFMDGVSPAKAVAPVPKKDVSRNDGVDAGKDGPKRGREASPRPRRSPVARRGGSPRRMDPRLENWL
ncbi:Serine/arginine-rich splicing factor SR45 [Bienertia sinuspersici]